MPLSLNFCVLLRVSLLPHDPATSVFALGWAEERKVGSGLLAEGNEVVVRVWRQQEASLRQLWRQKDAAVFVVEPKKCVLGKRGARFSINVLLSVQ